MRPGYIRVLNLVLSLFLIFVAAPASALELHLDATELGQVRKNINNKTELPLNTYLGFSANAPEAYVATEVNLRFFRDMKLKINDFDLYQTVLHVRPVDAFELSVGRQFISQGFATEVIDGFKAMLMPDSYVDVAIYSGVPRNAEIGDFRKNDGLTTGASVTMKNVPGTQGGIHADWRRYRIRDNMGRFNNSLFVGADLSHDFGGKVKPKPYGLIEYNVTGRVTETGTVGLDIYPHPRFGLNIEGDYYNVDRNSAKRTILGLLTKGRTMSAGGAATVTIIPDWLDFVANGSYQRITTHSGLKRNGYLMGASFQLSIDSIGMYLEPGYFFARSFGGTLHEGTFSLHEQFFKDLYASVDVDMATYKKITNNNDKAFGVTFWSGYQVVKGLWLSGGGEFNRNNEFNKEFRASFKVSYNFDHRS